MGTHGCQPFGWLKIKGVNSRERRKCKLIIKDTRCCIMDVFNVHAELSSGDENWWKWKISWLTSHANRRSSGLSVNFAINGPYFVPLLTFALANTAPLRTSRLCVWSCRNRDISSSRISFVIWKKNHFYYFGFSDVFSYRTHFLITVFVIIRITIRT